MRFVGSKAPIFFFIILPLITGILTLALAFAKHHVIMVFILILTTIILFSYASIRPDDIKRYLIENPEQAISELRAVKIIIPIVLSITIFFICGFIFGPSSRGSGDILANSVFALNYIFVGIASLLMYGLIISKKEIRFYISKFYSKSALERKDQQVHYFNKGVWEYNKYLRMHLKYQIKDINRIFLKMNLLDNDAKTEIIRSFSNSFGAENDKLAPLKCISLELMRSEDIESSLMTISFKSQLRVIGTFLVASIPIIISIITLYYTATTKH
jgi:hypothetical protein